MSRAQPVRLVGIAPAAAASAVAATSEDFKDFFNGTYANATRISFYGDKTKIRLTIAECKDFLHFLNTVYQLAAEEPMGDFNNTGHVVGHVLRALTSRFSKTGNFPIESSIDSMSRFIRDNCKEVAEKVNTMLEAVPLFVNKTLMVSGPVFQLPSDAQIQSILKNEEEFKKVINMYVRKPQTTGAVDRNYKPVGMPGLPERYSSTFDRAAETVTFNLRDHPNLNNALMTLNSIFVGKNPADNLSSVEVMNALSGACSVMKLYHDRQITATTPEIAVGALIDGMARGLVRDLPDDDIIAENRENIVRALLKDVSNHVGLVILAQQILRVCTDAARGDKLELDVRVANSEQFRALLEAGLRYMDRARAADARAESGRSNLHYSSLISELQLSSASGPASVEHFQAEFIKQVLNLMAKDGSILYDDLENFYKAKQAYLRAKIASLRTEIEENKTTSEQIAADIEDEQKRYQNDYYDDERKEALLKRAMSATKSHADAKIRIRNDADLRAAAKTHNDLLAEDMDVRSHDSFAIEAAVERLGASKRDVLAAYFALVRDFQEIEEEKRKQQFDEAQRNAAAAAAATTTRARKRMGGASFDTMDSFVRSRGEYREAREERAHAYGFHPRDRVAALPRYGGVDYTAPGFYGSSRGEYGGPREEHAHPYDVYPRDRVVALPRYGNVDYTGPDSFIRDTDRYGHPRFAAPRSTSPYGMRLRTAHRL